MATRFAAVALNDGLNTANETHLGKTGCFGFVPTGGKCRQYPQGQEGECRIGNERLVISGHDVFLSDTLNHLEMLSSPKKEQSILKFLQINTSCSQFGKK